MRNIMYKGITEDGKEVNIYDDGTCEGIELKCAFNMFEVFVNTRVGTILKKIRDLSSSKSVAGKTMKAGITKDEYGVQVWTDKEEQDHVIELESVEELRKTGFQRDFCTPKTNPLKQECLVMLCQEPVLGTMV